MVEIALLILLDSSTQHGFFEDDPPGLQTLFYYPSNGLNRVEIGRVEWIHFPFDL